MIAEILAVFAFLVENCTGIFIIQARDNNNPSGSQLQDPLLPESQRVLEDFGDHDFVFQEHEAPETLEEADPKAWKQSVPPLKTSLKKCLKTVLLIQTVAGSLIGLLVVGIVILDFIFAEWCYDMNDRWNEMPRKVQSLRVTAQAIEGGVIEMWDFACIIAIFPFSLIKHLHLLTLNMLAAFIDVSYRLYLQMIGSYGVSWKSFPLNALFTAVIIINNYVLARHFYPRSLKKTLKLDFILSAQFVLGLPAALLLVYVLFPWYLKQEPDVKIIIASCSPLLTAIPKVIARLGAQTLRGIIHPGTAHVLVTALYAASAVVFRLMQSELKDFSYFVLLGIAHGAIDLIERITITMRDHIWEYFYRLIRNQRQSLPQYRSPRSRRFIADVSIQIMLQESTSLISVLGFMAVYQALYTREKPFIDYKIVVEFFKRATVGLLIDLFFNTISVLIQTRVMNIAVCRLWRKKWRSHTTVNMFLVIISVIYFSEYLFRIVRDKYPITSTPIIQESYSYNTLNCTYPSFL